VVVSDPPIVLLAAAQVRAASLRRDVAEGLGASPKRVRSRWLWDERGSGLFDAITRLPEYYPTRCERALLAEHAPEIATRARAEELFELGSGSAEKATVLLDALVATGTLRRAVLLDVDEAAIRASLRGLIARYPALEITGMVADFEEQLQDAPGSDRRLLALLGSTAGALDVAERSAFLAPPPRRSVWTAPSFSVSTSSSHLSGSRRRTTTRVGSPPR
jgi:L-histidine N-alpha-methyltransferase